MECVGDVAVRALFLVFGKGVMGVVDVRATFVGEFAGEHGEVDEEWEEEE